MGECWNCSKDVFLKEEETRCDNCKKIVRYWCNSCAKPFDVENRKSKKKLVECKWCFFFICPNCEICSLNCPKHTHRTKIKMFLNGYVRIDKWTEIDNAIKKIVDYFEDVKLGKTMTMCEFGVPKTYAKERIKSILARIDGFKTRDNDDIDAFVKRQEEVLDKDIGEELIIGNIRESGSYGQEYRDIFNLCVCLGKLTYAKKTFKNKQGEDIEYDSWTRVENAQCPYLDMDNLVVKYCWKCKKIYPRNEIYCNTCIYPRGGKKHEKDSRLLLREKLSNNPTCTNLRSFKREGDNGESKPAEDD